MGDDRIRLLQDIPIFGGISEEVIAFLLERASSVIVPKGEYFFREGSRGHSTFVLEQGRVVILKWSNGADHALRHLEKGDCFGEMALLDLGPRSASVFAEEDCQATELTAGQLLEVAKTSLEQFAMIYMNFARELARRLRAADERLFRGRLEESPFAAGYVFRPD